MTDTNTKMQKDGVMIIKPWKKNKKQDEPQHLPWPDKSSDLNIIKPLWAVWERRAKSRFSPPTSLKQLADVLTDDILLETIHKLYETNLIRQKTVLKPNGGKTP